MFIETRSNTSELEDVRQPVGVVDRIELQAVPLSAPKEPYPAAAAARRLPPRYNRSTGHGSSHPTAGNRQRQDEIWIDKSKNLRKCGKILIAMKRLEKTFKEIEVDSLDADQQSYIKTELKAVRGRVDALDTQLRLAILEEKPEAKVEMAKQVQAQINVTGTKIYIDTEIPGLIGNVGARHQGQTFLMHEIIDDLQSAHSEQVHIRAKRLARGIRDDYVAQIVAEACDSYDEKREPKDTLLTPESILVKCENTVKVVETAFEQHQMRKLCTRLVKIVLTSKGTQAINDARENFDEEFYEWQISKAAEEREQAKMKSNVKTADAITRLQLLRKKRENTELSDAITLTPPPSPKVIADTILPEPNRSVENLIRLSRKTPAQPP